MYFTPSWLNFRPLVPTSCHVALKSTTFSPVSIVQRAVGEPTSLMWKLLSISVFKLNRCKKEKEKEEEEEEEVKILYVYIS